MKQIFVISPWRDVNKSAYESTQLLLSSTLVGSELQNKSHQIQNMFIPSSSTYTNLMCYYSDREIKSAFPVVLQCMK